MALTIPTSELLGILADVIPFASTDKQIQSLHAVLLEWDGATLHAMATDRYTAGWSRWTEADDNPDDQDAQQEELFTAYGGDDDPWRIVLHLAAAQQLLKAFKLPKGMFWTPLSVEKRGDALLVVRDRDGKIPAVRVLTPGILDVQFPPVRQVLEDRDAAQQLTAAGPTVAELGGLSLAGLRHQGAGTDRIAMEASRLARFAKVRWYGPLEMWFTPDRTALTLIRMGDRFLGAIAPVRVLKWDPDPNRPGTFDKWDTTLIETPAEAANRMPADPPEQTTVPVDPGPAAPDFTG